MRKFVWTTSFVALALAIGCTEPPKPQKAKNIDDVVDEEGEVTAVGSALGPLPKGPVAVVNGKDITLEDFRAIYDLKLQKYKDRDRDIPKTADRRYRKSITDRLIYQECLRQEGKELSVDYDKAALAEREEAQKRGIRDWEKHLRRRGESEESLREIYVAELRERAILEKKGKLTVTDEEIDEEYEKVKPNYNKDTERVRAAHILVRVGPGDHPPPGEKPKEPTEEEKKQWEEEALAKAKEIHALATAEGADFAALAKEKSDGPSARKGGDLGIFTADRMVEEFSKAAFALKEGEVSEPVKTKFGFHIIKSMGKYPAGDLPKEALVDQIRERLEARRLHQGRRELKDELLEKYKVKNIMEEHLPPDPRKNRKKKGKKDRRQGHPPGKSGKMAPPKGAPSPAGGPPPGAPPPEGGSEAPPAEPAK